MESIFDKLSLSISKDEREEILSRINANVSFNTEPLNTEFQDDEKIDLVKEYERIGFFEKLIIFLVSIFTQRDKYNILEDNLLNQVSSRIMKGYPGLIQYTKGEFQKPFLNELQDLKKALEILQEPIKTAIGPAKKDFISFLAGIELPHIEERFLTEMLPKNISREKGLSGISEIKREGDFRFDDIVMSISEDDRKGIYVHMQMINALHKLVFFPFEIIFQRFSSIENSPRDTCPMSEIRNNLEELGNILAGLFSSPTPLLIESLILFHKEATDAEDDDIDVRIKAAGKAINQIRSFTKSVPMPLILKLIFRKVNYSSTPVGGGEDWFLLYRQFWYDRFQKKITSFDHEMTQKSLINHAKDFLKVGNTFLLPYYRSVLLPQGISVKYEYSLGFLYQIIQKKFLKDYQEILKNILINGEFYKNQNKEEYTDSFNEIVVLNTEIESFDMKFSPSSEDGIILGKLIKKYSPENNNAKTLKEYLSKHEQSAKALVQRGITQFDTLSNVLNGLLYGTKGGRYDTLSNMGYVGGKDNKHFMHSLGETNSIIMSSVSILRDLYDNDNIAPQDVEQTE